MLWKVYGLEFTNSDSHVLQAGGFLGDAFVDSPASKALLDTLSKKKYGSQIKQQGGWAFMQDMLKASLITMFSRPFVRSYVFFSSRSVSV